MGEKILSFYDLNRKYRQTESTFQFYHLWHYTSAEGLLGIIKKAPSDHGKLHFWFTRSDCLNDPSEGKHILELFQNVCKRLVEDNRIDKKYYELIKDINIPAEQFINYPVPPHDDCDYSSVLDLVECDAYICSFSIKEDSLDMWRYYSKGNGGYGLKCWNLIFDQYRENSFFEIQDNDLFSLFRSFMVLYNRQEKENRLEKIILDTFSAFNNSDDSEKEKNALGFLRSQLKDLEFRFKNECYASEQEYRFVYYRPRKKPESMPFRLPEVLYRVQRGVIVPYIDIVVDRGASHLHEVMISPLVKEKNADKMTKDYLTQCGFDCPVRKSELPVRY